MFKNLLKIFGIIAGVIVFLFIIVILLLSVLFPNELVRKEIEKQGTEYLGVKLQIERLKFSIFSGFLINNISLDQYGSNWQSDKILRIGEAKLSYRLLPLLFTRTISVKALTLKDGEVKLEKNRKDSNWDYFLRKFSSSGSPKKESEVKKNASKPISKNIIPVNLDIKKLGIENFSVSYFDNTILNKNLAVAVKELKILGKNLNIKENKPFDLDSGLIIDIKYADNISLKSKLTAIGKLKLFDDKGELKISGPVDLVLQDGIFLSKEIRELISDILKDYFGGELGVVVKNILKDPRIVTEESDKYFNSILDKSKESVEKSVAKVKELIKTRKEMESELNKLTLEFDKETSSTVESIDKKIQEVDSRISPILDVAQNLPLVERYADIKSYRAKVKNLRNEIKNKKDALVSRERNSFVNSMRSKIDEAFPKKEITNESLLRDFNNLVVNYKNEIKRQLSKITDSEIFSSIFKSIDSFDREWKINKISIPYYLGKDQQESKDVFVDLNFLSSNGLLKQNKENIDYTGDVTFLLSTLNITFIPLEKITLKINIFKDNSKLQYKLIDKPKLTFESDKLKNIGVNIINNFLSANYSIDKTMHTLLKNVPLKDIDVDGLKKSFLSDKISSSEKIKSGGNEIKEYADREIEKIIKELKRKIPGI